MFSKPRVPTVKTQITDPFGRTENSLPISGFFCNIVVWSGNSGAVPEIPQPSAPGCQGKSRIRLGGCRGVSPPDPSAEQPNSGVGPT